MCQTVAKRIGSACSGLHRPRSRRRCIDRVLPTPGAEDHSYVARLKRLIRTQTSPKSCKLCGFGSSRNTKAKTSLELGVYPAAGQAHTSATLSMTVEAICGCFRCGRYCAPIRLFGAGAISLSHGEIVADRLGCFRNRAGKETANKKQIENTKPILLARLEVLCCAQATVCAGLAGVESALLATRGTTCGTSDSQYLLRGQFVFHS